jgi:hypothetical protein
LFGPLLVSENGGSAILSYEIQMDNGNGGSFVSLIGGSSNSMETVYLISTGITVGTLYRFRYRALNTNGWSEFSPINYIAAATVPARPPTPKFLSATITSVTLSLFKSINSRGSQINSYELWVNGGGNSLAYS